MPNFRIYVAFSKTSFFPKKEVRFKAHIKARLTFIQSDLYAQVFQVPAVTIVYLTTISHQRRDSMTQWTEEVLQELEMEEWGGVFKFGYVEEDTIYTMQLFTQALYREPGKRNLVSLFD